MNAKYFVETFAVPSKCFLAEICILLVSYLYEVDMLPKESYTFFVRHKQDKQ